MTYSPSMGVPTPHTLMSLPLNHSEVKSFKRCERLPSSRSHLWMIQAGVVRTLTWSEEGDVTSLGFWGTGSLVGAFITQVFPYEIECLTNVQVKRISPTAPLPRDILLKHVAQSTELMKILHCNRVDSRLEQFIGWLAIRFGQHQADGIHLTVRLTHQQLAEAIATTRVTVTRILGQLERDGKISWSRNHQISHPSLLDQWKR